MTNLAPPQDCGDRVAAGAGVGLLQDDARVQGQADQVLQFTGVRPCWFNLCMARGLTLK